MDEETQPLHRTKQPYSRYRAAIGLKALRRHGEIQDSTVERGDEQRALEDILGDLALLALHLDLDWFAAVKEGGYLAAQALEMDRKDHGRV
jgi:hypothetical protein